MHLTFYIKLLLRGIMFKSFYTYIVFQCSERPIDCNMSINCFPAPYDTRSRPNIKGTQFFVFEFLMLHMKPRVCKPHNILCSLVFNMLQLTGFDITSASNIPWTNGHFSFTSSKISLNSDGLMLSHESNDEPLRIPLSQTLSRILISSLITAF